MHWHIKQYKRRRPVILLKELWLFFKDRIGAIRLFQVASGLTLTSVMSLVPLMAVLLAGFVIFPEFEHQRQTFEHWVLGSVLPDVYQSQIIQYLHQFSMHASGLTIFGLIGLGVTALLMINTVDVTVNSLFNVRKMRPSWQRFLVYATLLTFGPLLIAASISLTQMLTANQLIPARLPNSLLLLIQLTLQSLVYALLYRVVPNCFVAWRHALIGGTVVSFLGLAIKWGFSLYLASGPLRSIYGAFAAIPVALLWIYLAWILFLAGAAIAATLPMLMSGRFADTHRQGNDFFTGIVILSVLMRSIESGQRNMTLKQICKSVDTYPECAIGILESLSDIGYVARFGSEYGENQYWGLVVNPKESTLGPVIGALLIDPKNTLIARENAPLYDWYNVMLDNQWNRRPMSETLRFVHPM